MSLIYLSVAWVAGILLGSKADLPFALIFAGLFPLIFLFFFPRYRKPLILISLCLLAFFGGAVHFFPAVAESGRL